MGRRKKDSKKKHERRPVNDGEGQPRFRKYADQVGRLDTPQSTRISTCSRPTNHTLNRMRQKLAGESAVRCVLCDILARRPSMALRIQLAYYDDWGVLVGQQSFFNQLPRRMVGQIRGPNMVIPVPLYYLPPGQWQGPPNLGQVAPNQWPGLNHAHQIGLQGNDMHGQWNYPWPNNQTMQAVPQNFINARLRGDQRNLEVPFIDLAQNEDEGFGLNGQQHNPVPAARNNVPPQVEPDPIVNDEPDNQQEIAAQLDHAGQDNDPGNECSICMERKKTHVFVDCGHLCVCATCMLKGINTCPICRMVVTSRPPIRVFL
ncbi:hypothetical protein QAD02_013516 [Eretmocerus hayati]|uniref:Uncharacterized protein n=1 Tax=Eretmocerus hayati TaxID=131215 RepID=A0ACC2P326_9HYME|nr:hypothetical protein QAD02_013516 [Eretmocerus hayati]